MRPTGQKCYGAAWTRERVSERWNKKLSNEQDRDKKEGRHFSRLNAGKNIPDGPNVSAGVIIATDGETGRGQDAQQVPM